MRRSLSVLIGIVLLLQPLPATVQAQTQDKLPASMCLSQITTRIQQQQRIFRAVLFGRTEAARELEGMTRYDEQGIPWIKTGQNLWVSAVGVGTRSDAQIDETAEWEGMNDLTTARQDLRASRQGIFQTPGALTSDLIPSVLEAYRAFHCRLAMVCEGTQQSQTSGNEPLEVTTLGCGTLRMAPVTQCQFAAIGEANDSTRRFIDPGSAGTISAHCTPLVDQLLRDEAQMLKLAVSYDAAVRSVLQFGGTFDTFLDSWKGDVLSPLEQTVSLVHNLSRIPCFLAQCTNQ